LRVASKQSRLIQQSGHILPRDAVIDSYFHAFMAEIIGHCQIFQSATIAQAVRHKIHAPDLIDSGCQLQRNTLMHRALGFLAFANSQIGISVKPVDPLVIHARELRSQHVMDAAVTESATLLRHFHHSIAQGLRLSTGMRHVAKTISA
jgi:hypothetical protein